MISTYKMAFNFEGCSGSDTCNSPSDCPHAFTNPTNGKPIQCTANNVGVSISVCGVSIHNCSRITTEYIRLTSPSAKGVKLPSGFNSLYEGGLDCVRFYVSDMNKFKSMYRSETKVSVQGGT